MEESNHNTMIRIAVGVIVTLVLVGIVLSIVFKVMPSINNANKKMDNLTQQMDVMYYNSFNGTKVSGSEVISAINTRANGECTVTVTTAAGSTIKYNSASYNKTQPSETGYIEPSATFTSTLNKNANGSTVGITFVAK